MKMSVPVLALLIAISIAGCSDTYPAATVDPVSDTLAVEIPTEGMITLYSADPLAHTFSFSRNAYGMVIQGDQVKNSGSDIDFGSYYPDEFSVGIEGG
ncbi:MAG: hypothetical protein ABIR47_17235, partial [Candidatus Kapaibacterium sp.]